MPSGCSIRALWILNSLDAVVLSRKFPVVEKQWRAACKTMNDNSNNTEEDLLKHTVSPFLPNDAELSSAFAERKKREGSLRGYGIRVNNQSVKGSDSWVDDPITRHIISINVESKVEGGENHLLWPLILHLRGSYVILVLPLVEPVHLKAYAKLCRKSDCGNAVGVDASLSSILLDTPSITGYGSFMVAHAIGDIIVGDVVDPEVVVNAAPSVGGLLDSLTGSIGITGPWIKIHFEIFISSAMPFGTPLDLNYSNIFAIKANGFSSSDLLPADFKQPAWKPYLFKGKQRILFTINETIHAALYDREEISDTISVSGSNKLSSRIGRFA
ncbi:hypothetical protein OIU84_018466 [Salix udensis]|uniref:Uncharacterized protein n=1 Tax=Salix udensis TaxID=889485 RepID=A0AAD6PIF1_9ROSI|nr:hypothetical protein OIU84_018466 [Salix udensis]